MNINIFKHYKLKINNKYSYIADKIGPEYIFKDDETITDMELNGGKLMEMIADEMKNDKTVLVSFDQNKDDKKFQIYFSTFNPLTGEGSDILYKIEEVKEMEVKDEEIK